MVKEKNTIAFGITGSIAAYKTLDIIKKLIRLGNAVHVVMTESATALVNPKEFERVSRHPVSTALFAPSVDYRAYLSHDKKIDHIALADIADMWVICPATANTIGKVASGIADSLLTSSILATNAPVLFCPAMNVKMWQNPILQKNLRYLRDLGYLFIDPEFGELACGYTGVGRLAGGEKILGVIREILDMRNIFKGKKIIVTAGGTQEAIDQVRVITNKASGKMGAAIADICTLWGADVSYIHGLHAVLPSRLTKNIPVETAADMLNAMKSEIGNAEIIFHAAAVSDFSLKEPFEGKVKSNAALHLELTPQTKILDRLKQLNPHVTIIGFKAEYNVSEKELIDRAYETLQKAHADWIVANDVGKKGRGFGVDTNEVWIVDKKKKVTHVPLSSKREIGKRIVESILPTKDSPC